MIKMPRQILEKVPATAGNSSVQMDSPFTSSVLLPELSPRHAFLMNPVLSCKKTPRVSARRVSQFKKKSAKLQKPRRPTGRGPYGAIRNLPGRILKRKRLRRNKKKEEVKADIKLIKELKKTTEAMGSVVGHLETEINCSKVVLRKGMLQLKQLESLGKDYPRLVLHGSAAKAQLTHTRVLCMQSGWGGLKTYH